MRFFSKTQEPKKEIPKIEEKKSNISLNEMKQTKEENKILKEKSQEEPSPKKLIFKSSNVKKFEVIEPDYAKFK